MMDNFKDASSTCQLTPMARKGDNEPDIDQQMLNRCPVANGEVTNQIADVKQNRGESLLDSHCQTTQLSVKDHSRTAAHGVS